MSGKITREDEHVVLIVLDGWGIAPAGKYNAISLASKPNFDYISKKFGEMQLCASGKCVGLPDGQMGNSEVGHLTIGAGRIILQDQVRIDDEINSGRMRKNKVLVAGIKSSIASNSTLHFVGLLSDSGVHSQIRHLFALMEIASEMDAKRIALDAILDGRDTPPKSCISYINKANGYMKRLGRGSITTLSGRYYAMDRDEHWDRTKRAYDSLVYGEGDSFTDSVEAVKRSYKNGITDEFFVPEHAKGYKGLCDNDVIILFNFRPDRARQLAEALSAKRGGFNSRFDRDESRMPKKIKVISLTVYDDKLNNVDAIIKQESVSNTLSSVIGASGIHQFHTAETEKYAHVTYFFNGLIEKPVRLEKRSVVRSPNVPLYDKTPEMSARKITNRVIGAMKSSEYGFVLANFANADMVGHTGKLEATTAAVECVDSCIGEIVQAWEAEGSECTIVITADHGNAEKKFDSVSKQPSTSHTSNPVPLIVISDIWKLRMRPGYKAGLRDIAPSVLRIMGLDKPDAMTGTSLVEKRQA
jgi:2,3-bisphosphoglycerate-independent phosphoglycerate mutase